MNGEHDVKIWFDPKGRKVFGILYSDYSIHPHAGS